MLLGFSEFDRNKQKAFWRADGVDFVSMDCTLVFKNNNNNNTYLTRDLTVSTGRGKPHPPSNADHNHNHNPRHKTCQHTS
jgi:hypothetical protein